MIISEEPENCNKNPPSPGKNAASDLEAAFWKNHFFTRDRAVLRMGTATVVVMISGTMNPPL